MDNIELSRDNEKEVKPAYDTHSFDTVDLSADDVDVIIRDALYPMGDGEIVNDDVVRKFKEVENISQDYIYLGDVYTIDGTVSGEKPVTMNFALHSLPQDLYNDLITKVDLTKID